MNTTKPSIVSFLYSFMFSSFDLTKYISSGLEKFQSQHVKADKDSTIQSNFSELKEEMNEILTSLGKRIEGSISKNVLLDCKPKNLIVEFHHSEERVAEDFRLPIYFAFPHFSIEYELSSNLVKEFSDGHREIVVPNSSTKINLILFESGSGLLLTTLDISSPHKPIDEEEMVDITQAGLHKNSGNDRYRLLFGGSYSLTIFELFENTVSEFFSSLAGIETSNAKLFHDLRWVDWDVIAPDTTVSKQYPSSLRGVWQSPYVFLALCREGKKDVDQLLHDKNTINYFLKLLFQKKCNVDFEYAKLYEIVQVDTNGVHIVDLYPSKDVFMNFNSAICLVVVNDFDEGNRISDIAYRIFGSGRLTWHTYNVINAELGHTILEAHDALRRTPKQDWKAYDDGLKKVKKRILRVKYSFIRALTNEDPLRFGAKQTPYGRLYEKAIGDFNVPGLYSSIWNKISELNRSYDLVNESISESRFLFKIDKRPKRVRVFVYAMCALVVMSLLSYLGTIEGYKPSNKFLGQIIQFLQANDVVLIVVFVLALLVLIFFQTHYRSK